MGTKLVEHFANKVVERRNMINVYLRGELVLRVLGGCWFSESANFEFLLLFSWFWCFSCLLLVLQFFLLLDDFFELFVGFLSSSCASWGLEFEIQTLCFCCQ
jgi:hypothetical protein